MNTVSQTRQAPRVLAVGRHRRRGADGGNPPAAINQAREKANAAACASNLRQLYQAVMLFQLDHEGGLPRASVAAPRKKVQLAQYPLPC